MKPKEEFLQDAEETLSIIYDMIKNLKRVSLSKFSANDTVFIIIDMINGFVKKGPLSSNRIYQINEKVADLAQKMAEKRIETLVFADSHAIDNPEFLSYPVHCLTGSDESKLTDEIARKAKYTLIKKNSTNAFLVPEFLEWLSRHEDTKNFIVVGNCTDICVLQFVVTLKAWFHQNNKNVLVTVPAEFVQTYDSDIHHGDFFHLTALYQMILGGIEVVLTIENEKEQVDGRTILQYKTKPNDAD